MTNFNSYKYNENGIQHVLKCFEYQQACNLTISGWRRAAAYNMLKNFAELECHSGGYKSAIATFIFSIPVFNLGFVAVMSRVKRYSMTIDRNESVTTVTFLPE